MAVTKITEDQILFNLEDIDNVNITSLTDNDIIKYNAATSKWINVSSGDIFNPALNSLSDVNVPTPTDGQALIWDNVTTKWIAGEAGTTINSIDDISDVVLTSITSGEVLKWNGTNWINNTLSEAGIATDDHNHNLNDLIDTAITSITIGELLKWDGTKWINNTLSEAGISADDHTHEIDDITTFNITTPTDGELLKYDTASTKWINTNISDAGISEIGHNHVASDITSGTISSVLGVSASSTTKSFLVFNGNEAGAGNLYGGTVNPTNVTRLNYDGYFYATRVYNAIYNDIADFVEISKNTKIIYGKCYYITETGVKLCNKRCQKGILGIASDTFGIGVGNKNNSIPIGIAGWVLAYISETCEAGDVLTNDEFGNLVKMTEYEKSVYPERIIAMYMKKENKNKWGPENNLIEVNNRHWVKIL